MNYKINTDKYKEKTFPYHKHEYYETLIFLNGKGRVSLEDREYPIEKGNIVVVPPDCTHGTLSDEDLQCIYIIGDFGGVLNFKAPVILSDNDKGEGTALVRLIYNNRYGNQEYINSLCKAYAHFILLNLKIEDGIEKAVGKIVEKIVNGFYDSNFCLNATLIQSGYVEDYIRAHFKRITGKTPNAFLTEIRMKHAVHLIEIYKNACSLSDIAELCGYTDYIYFSRKFKSVVGVSPQQYKNRLKGDLSN